MQLRALCKPLQARAAEVESTGARGHSNPFAGNSPPSPPPAPPPPPAAPVTSVFGITFTLPSTAFATQLRE